MRRIFARTWQVVGVRGVASVLLGLGILFWPQQTVSLLKSLFAVFALVYGVLTLIGGLRNPAGRKPLPLIKGGIGIGLGVVAFLFPDMTGQILLYLIAAYSLATGILDILAAFRLSPEQGSLRPYHLGTGIAGTIFGLLLILQPGEGALAQAGLIGLYFVLVGAIMLLTAFHILRKPEPVASAAV